MQGFILDGFPQNVVQLKALVNLKIVPDTIFVLELEDKDEVSFDRLKNRNKKP